jgi:CBS domain-containing protein
VPTCHLDEKIADVRRRVQAASWDVSVVVNEARIVLGFLQQAALNADSERLIEQVMGLGPRYRLSAELEKAKTYMEPHGIDSVLVTTTDGELVGLLKRQDVE